MNILKLNPVGKANGLAIRACHQQKAKLLIAKFDRLSPNVVSMMTILNSGVDFATCDLPDANKLTVGMMVTFAQYKF